MHVNRTLKNKNGVTLIELLVALVISALLIAALYQTFIGQQKTYIVQEQVVDMQQNVRVAINKMMREIRMAGFGNISTVLPVTFLGGTRTYPNVVNPDLPVPGALTIVSGIGGTATLLKQPGDLVGPILLASNRIQVSSLAEFNTDNKRYISIGGLEGHAIIGIDVGNKILTLNSDVNSVYKTDGSTLVYAIRAISYRVDVDQPDSPILRRDENTGGGAQPLAENIENLGFRYFDGGTPTTPPQETADLAKIRMIEVTVTARTDRADPDFKGEDGFRRRTIASNIHVRNMGISQ